MFHKLLFATRMAHDTAYAQSVTRKTLLAKPYPDVQKLPRNAESSFFVFEFSFSLLSYFRHQIHGKTWFILFSTWLKNYVKCLNLQSLCWLFLSSKFILVNAAVLIQKRYLFKDELFKDKLFKTLSKIILKIWKIKEKLFSEWWAK